MVTIARSRPAAEGVRARRARGRAAIRARQEERPPLPPHAVELRPLGGEGAIIVDAPGADFLPALMADLQAPDWRAKLAARRLTRRGTDGSPELSQPMHRRFHLVLLEAICREPGFPRVDPDKLSGMGLVMRRENRRGPLAWMKRGGRAEGWRRVLAEDADPEPVAADDRRPRAAVALEKMLSEQRAEPGQPAAEQTAPLFVAPPEVCTALKRTVLFGVIPLVSGETTEAPPPLDNLDASEDAKVTRHFSLYLKKDGLRFMPFAGQTLDPLWKPLSNPDAGGEQGRLYAYAVFLRQLGAELGVFDEGEAQAALRARLDEIRLPLNFSFFSGVTEDIGAAEFAEKASDILLSEAPNADDLRMPLWWPPVTQDDENELLALARACLTERFAQMVPEQPKFDDDAALYRVRAYCHVEGHEHCPPKLVWSVRSEPFRIRPWWDSDAPPIRVSLPDVGQARKVKPGVAFGMPPALANLLQGDMKKLSDGEKPGGGGLELGWLCSFSIPIITLCAFIVLNIFLSLFNIIFSWILWIRICLPFPKPRSD